MREKALKVSPRRRADECVATESFLFVYLLLEMLESPVPFAEGQRRKRVAAPDELARLVLGIPLISDFLVDGRQRVGRQRVAAAAVELGHLTGSFQALKGCRLGPEYSHRLAVRLESGEVVHVLAAFHARLLFRAIKTKLCQQKDAGALKAKQNSSTHNFDMMKQKLSARAKHTFSCQ